jgi:hypothetical protein
MDTGRNRSRKRFQLDPGKIEGTQKALQNNTETETIERPLDLATADDKNRRALCDERRLRLGSVRQVG